MYNKKENFIILFLHPHKSREKILKDLACSQNEVSFDLAYFLILPMHDICQGGPDYQVSVPKALSTFCAPFD